MTLTHHETHILIVVGMLLLAIFAAYQIYPAYVVNAFLKRTEFLYLLCLAIPLGFYLALDRERLPVPNL